MIPHLLPPPPLAGQSLGRRRQRAPSNRATRSNSRTRRSDAHVHLCLHAVWFLCVRACVCVRCKTEWRKAGQERTGLSCQAEL